MGCGVGIDRGIMMSVLRQIRRMRRVISELFVMIMGRRGRGGIRLMMRGVV